MPEHGHQDPATYERILDAAVECFEARGVSKTTMEEIARAAGVSRKTVYNYAHNRTRLFAAAVERETRERLCPRAAALIDFSLPADELVAVAETNLLDQIRATPFIDGVLTDDALQQALALIGYNERIADILTDYWNPVLDAVERAGRLRTDASRAELMTWLMSIHLLLASRQSLFDHHDRRSMRDVVRRFVFPALTGPVAAGSARRGRSG